MLRLVVFLLYNGRLPIGTTAAGLRTDRHGAQAEKLGILQRAPIRKGATLPVSPVYAGVVLWVHDQPRLLGKRLADRRRGINRVHRAQNFLAHNGQCTRPRLLR